MSGWFYLKEGMFDDSEKGPLSDATMLQMAFDGELKSKTRVRHPVHTKDQWVYVEQIPAAKKRIDDGDTARRDKVAGDRAAREAAKQGAAEKQRELEAERQASAAQALASSPIRQFLGDGQDQSVISKVFDRVSQLLTSQESIEYMAVSLHIPGFQSPDCAVATNRRFLIIHQKILGRMEFEDYQWLDLFDAQLKDGFVSSEIMFRHVSGRAMKVGYLPKTQARRLYRIVQEREEQARQSRYAMNLETKRAAAGGVHVSVGASAPVPPSEDPVAKLAKLKQMLDAGLIEKSEYEETKKRILGSL